MFLLLLSPISKDHKDHILKSQWSVFTFLVNYAVNRNLEVPCVEFTFTGAFDLIILQYTNVNKIMPSYNLNIHSFFVLPWELRLMSRELRKGYLLEAVFKKNSITNRDKSLFYSSCLYYRSGDTVESFEFSKYQILLKTSKI